MSKHLKISCHLFWRVHVLESTFWHQVEQVGDEADHLMVTNDQAYHL